MAAKKTRSRSSGSGRSDSRSSGRSASQKGGKYRFAQNVGEERTVAEREYLDYALSDHREMGDDPDVLLDVPVVKVDSIHLELENLNAHVALKTRVLDLVKLDVGVDAHLGKLRHEAGLLGQKEGARSGGGGAPSSRGRGVIRPPLLAPQAARRSLRRRPR